MRIGANLLSRENILRRQRTSFLMSDWPTGPESQSLSRATWMGRRKWSRGAEFVAGTGWIVPLLIGLVGSLVGGVRPVRAAEGRIEQVTVGLDGICRMGQWTTVRAKVAEAEPGGQLALRVSMSDPDDQWAILRGPARAMDASGAGIVEAAVRVGRPELGLRVELIDAEGNVVDQRRIAMEDAAGQSGVVAKTPLRHDVSVWALLGGPAGFSGPKALAGGRKVLALESAAALPTLAAGYGGVDALVVSTGTEAWAGVTAEQWAAVEEWVRNGGHLALTVGENSLAVAKSPLMSWLPVPVVEAGVVRQLGRIESYCGAGIPVTMAGAIPRARFGPFQGLNLVDDNDGPLLARVSYGFGLVTVLAVDLDRPPLSEWTAVDDLGPMLLESAVDRTRLQSASEAPLRHQGLSDLGSQVATALDQFPQVRRTSYWTVLGQLLALLILVGPLDYVLTNRWLKRPMLTWVTLPVWLILGLTGASSIAGAFNGGKTLANQWTLIDVDGSRGAVRGTAWTTVYSPRTARVEVAVKPETLGGVAAARVRMSWIAEPEGSPGGLYRGSGLTGGRSSYELTESGEAKRPALAQWSTKAYLAEWSQVEPGATKWVESQLESSGPSRLAGSITWNLEEPLEEFLLVFGGRVFFVADGRPNRLLAYQPWEPTGAQGQQRDFRAYLTGTTGRRVKISGSRDELQFRAEPYDPLDFDPLRLMRMLTFHDVTGGRPYTGMDHRLFRRLELTPAMHAGQAILVGRMKRAGASVVVDGQTVSWDADGTAGQGGSGTQSTGTRAAGTQETFLRVVLPVKTYFEEEKLLDKELREKLQKKAAAKGR